MKWLFMINEMAFYNRRKGITQTAIYHNAAWSLYPSLLPLATWSEATWLLERSDLLDGESKTNG
jgi:hypothetical protein